MTYLRPRKRALSLAVLLVAVLFLSGCRHATTEQKAREQAQSQKATGNTLEKQNLAEKRKREENPNQIGYLYLMAFDKPFGYFVTKGKISNSGSQATPEQDVVQYCKNDDCAWVTVDGPQDDGSYGAGDPGVFFFTPEGVMVETSLDYFYTTQPLSLNVPKLSPGDAGSGH